MVKNYLKKKYVFTIAAVILIMILVFREPSAGVLPLISKTPLRYFVQYEWDISRTRDHPVTAVMTWKKEGYCIRISGEGEMVDFSSKEKRIGWYELQMMVTGWQFRLNEVQIQENVFNVGKYAFLDFPSLKKVTLPSSIQRIESYAFMNCTSLNSIVFKGTAKEWESIKKEKDWAVGSGITSIKCIDSTINIM